MGCTGSSQARDVAEPPSLPEVDAVKARENAKPVSCALHAFGECPDAVRGHKKYLIFYLIKVKLEDPDSGMQFETIVYRRYSQFELFRERMLKSRLYESIPALPRKKFFGKTNSNNSHLSQRQKDLGSWLDRISDIPNVYSDDNFVSFLTDEADEKPDGINIQTNERESISLKGEESRDDAASISDHESIDSNPDARAISATVYALGKSPDEKRPGKYTIFFIIRVKLEASDSNTNSTCIVYRRFSEFERFRNILLKSKRYDNIPPLPKKKLIGTTNKNDVHTQNRQNELESWLRLVCQLPGIATDQSFQCFLTEGAGDEPAGFQLQFHSGVVGRLSDDESSDEDSEEECLGEGDNYEAWVNEKHHTEPITSKKDFGIVSLKKDVEVPPPPPSTTFVYQGMEGYGSGQDSTKSTKNKSCIYYTLRVHSSTIGVKGVHEFFVYRRFSEFEKLRQNLIKSKRYGTVPPLPKKKVFGNTSSNTGHMMNRKKELTAWMCIITDSLPNISADPSYIAFISSDEDKVPQNFTLHGTFVQF